MDPSDQGYSPAIRLDRAFNWLHRTPILPDEALSSWLARAAFDQGSDPLSFTGGLWPKWRVWTLDVDRALPNPHAKVLAYQSGVAIDQLRSMTFSAELQAISTLPLAPHGRWTWLRGLGARNRRRKGGMQYCPICLGQDARPYFRKAWRIAWHVACPQHNQLLMEHCPACAAAVEYSRLGLEHSNLANCAGCLASLAMPADTVRSTSDQSLDLAGALQLQAQADQQYAAAQKGDLKAVSWFSRLHFCLCIARACLRESLPAWASLAVSLRLKNADEIWGFGSVQLEDLTAVQRLRLLNCAFPLLNLGVKDWVSALRAAGVTKQGLSNIAEIPDCLGTLASQLPATQRASRTTSQSKREPAPVSPATVRRRWERLKSQYSHR